MARWKANWPGVEIIWSQIIPRRAWRGARSQIAVNNIRKNVNRAMAKYAEASGVKIINHNDIVYGCPGLYRADGVHLSDIGIDIFNLNIQSALEKITEFWRQKESK
ncbi:hypothetical protein GDO86_003352 [Hymenochirus boettgeri]|uniref:SGNH hydrolase-type esterase domain-containing protein n=1 Tax=Hymenochirus boettgeri TaxID=247094 RepID=A0A8T2K6P0_9PIPI|nr:hypothetical protein GDO86_003352 [Hymenochirus boettgeri]